jgi:hypothetical protein
MYASPSRVPNCRENHVERDDSASPGYGIGENSGAFWIPRRLRASLSI